MEAGSIVEQPDRRAPRSGTGTSCAPACTACGPPSPAAWGEHADYVDARGAGVTERDARRLAAAAGRARARARVRPGWRRARGGRARRARRRGRPLRRRRRDDRDRGSARRGAAGSATCSTRVLDLESIDEPDASYDVVLCREGLMFAPDPARAAREIRRVLRPGGRVAIAVWGPRERNPWLGLVFDAVSAQIGRARPPARRSRPVLAGRLRARSSRCSPTPGWPTCRSASCRRRCAPAPSRSGGRGRLALAGPLAKILASLPERRCAGAAASACARRSRPYTTPTGVEIPGVTLIASARR